MSIVALSPGRSIQNAVYIALGASIGVWYFTTEFPTLFETDLKAAIAGILFIASLVGALLFYIKPERLLLWFYRWWIYFRNTSVILKFVVIARIKLEIWRIAITEDWESPEEEAKFSIRDATTSPDLFEDIWSLIGACYFIAGIPFLVLALKMDWISSLLVSIILIGIVLISLSVNQWHLPKRIYKVALFRGFQEADSRSEKDSPIISSKKLLEELENMIRNRAWLRFERRFQYIIDEFRIKEFESVEELESYFFNSAIQYAISKNADNRNQVNNLILVINDVLVSDLDVSQSNLSKSITETLDLIIKPCTLTEKIFSSELESQYTDMLIDLLLSCQTDSPEFLQIGWMKRVFTLILEMKEGSIFGNVRKFVSVLGSFDEEREICEIIEEILEIYALAEKWNGAPGNVLRILGNIRISSRSQIVQENANKALLTNLIGSPESVLDLIDISVEESLQEAIDFVYASDDNISKPFNQAIERALDSNPEQFFRSISIIYSSANVHERHSAIVLLGTIAGRSEQYGVRALRLLDETLLDTDDGNVGQAVSELIFLGDEQTLKYLNKMKAGPLEASTADQIKYVIDAIEERLQSSGKIGKT